MSESITEQDAFHPSDLNLCATAKLSTDTTCGPKFVASVIATTDSSMYLSAHKPNVVCGIRDDQNL